MEPSFPITACPQSGQQCFSDQHANRRSCVVDFRGHSVARRGDSSDHSGPVIVRALVRLRVKIPLFSVDHATVP